MKILCVCGARPNFMKVAPIMEQLGRSDRTQRFLVHTGQHYDEKMSGLFFSQLGMPQPNANLEVGSGSHAQQTAEVMKRFEPVCIAQRPDWVVVVGDVNSTLACALVSAKLGVKVAHVEAGLRSFDRSMPEEINRVVTDSISDALFVTEPSGLENLGNEGVASERVHFVGNVMADTLLRHKDRAEASAILERLSLQPGGYAAATLHRPSNVDDAATLAGILAALERISADMPVVFPVHPRTRKNLESGAIGSRLLRADGIRLIDPLGYLDFLKLMSNAAIVLTDSGGIQEETTILGVPCLTLRENTERPITIVKGTNRLVGCQTANIIQAYEETMSSPPRGNIPDRWDGRAAERIVAIITGEPVGGGATSRSAMGGLAPAH